MSNNYLLFIISLFIFVSLISPVGRYFLPWRDALFIWKRRKFGCGISWEKIPEVSTSSGSTWIFYLQTLRSVGIFFVKLNSIKSFLFVIIKFLWVFFLLHVKCYLIRLLIFTKCFFRYYCTWPNHFNTFSLLFWP